MGFSLTSGSGTGFNLGGSETSGFSLPGSTSNPSSLYALDSSSSAPGSYAGYFSDTGEAAKMNQFYPQNGSNWFENLATYGATRAIDSHFASAATDKTLAGATYAGANGRTNTVGQAGGAVTVSNNLLLLMLIGGAVILMAD